MITIQPTNNTDKVGQWCLLVNKKISTPQLENIEETIQKAPKSNPQVFKFIPFRVRQATENYRTEQQNY